MMRVFPTVLLLLSQLLFVSAAVPGSGTWTLSSAPGNLGYTFLVSSYSGQNLFAPAGTQMTRSGNNGDTWNTYTSGSIPTIAAGSNNSQIINGFTGYTILRSTDYGASFSTMSQPPGPTNTAVTDITTDGTGNIVYVVTSGYVNDVLESIGNVYTSTDGAATWASITRPTDYGFYTSVACSSNGQIALFSSEYGEVFRTSNTGASWVRVYNPPQRTQGFRNLVFSANSLYAYGVFDYFGVLRSADAGLTWTTATSPGSYSIYDLATDATGQYLIACCSDGLYTSADFGNSWVTSFTQSAPGAATACEAVSSDSSGLFLAAAYPSTSTLYGGIYLNNAIPLPSLSPTAYPTSPTSLPTAQPTNPTSWPTSMPSSSPSCSLGSAHTGEQGGACSPCVPGEYISDLGGVCAKCPKGKYSSVRGATACKDCTFPSTSVFEGESECTGYSVYEGTTNLIVVLLLLFLFAFGPVLVLKHRMVVLVNLFFPGLDVISDITYLVGNDFYSPALFYVCLLFIIFPVVFFARLLVKESTYPKIYYNIMDAWWLKAGRDGDSFYYAVFPYFSDGRFPVISCKTHGNLGLVFLEGFVWVLAVIAQIGTLLLWVMLAVTRIALLVVWFVLGTFSYMTKTITIGRVWNVWFRVWTGGNAHETDVEVDTHALNTSLQQEFYFETLPQVVIQLVNTFLLRQLSPLAIFSLLLSFIMAINGLYKYIYYRWLTDTSMQVEDIPIDMSLHVKVDCLHIDWLFFEAKLQPMRRSPSAKKRRQVPAGLLTV